MKSETKTCQSCNKEFNIEPEDFEFYEKFQVPPPTFCPECRLVRRMTFRNERALYKRACDLCKKEFIFFLPADSKFPVYCRDCWWGDKWDAKSYGRDYDFSKPFFQQFHELLNSVPRPGTIKQGNIVDSEYTNRVTDMRNCYLIFGTTVAENCRYGVWLNGSKECMDCYGAQKSEKCYECVDVFQCYNLKYSQECQECSDSAFLYNCRSCSNCFGCVNLRNKSYCIFNKQYTKDEYQKMMAQFDLGSSLVLDGVGAKLEELKKKNIVPAQVAHHSVNSSGNWLESCKNVYRSFNMLEVEDGRYCYNLLYAKDVMDFGPWSNKSERIYEAINVGIQCANVKFAHECWSQLLDSEYVMNCHNGKNLFGCVGLRNAEYCIFNKQYSRDEYKDMVEKIKKHMNDLPYKDKKGREYKYGEFFPIEISPHAYNETIAQEFFPLDKDEARELGYPWREMEEKNYSLTKSADDLHDSIAMVDDSVLKETVGCAHAGACKEQCTTAFRIIPEELAFDRNMQIPLPHLCPNCRHHRRLKQRNPLKLWTRQCAKCGKSIETSYAPPTAGGRPEIVYCEQCYNGEVV